MKTLRRCKHGHPIYKSTDCRTCPICEKEAKPIEGFLSVLVAPSRRALENNGISKLEYLTKYSEKEILKFHGFGKSSLPILKSLLDDKELSIK